MTGEKMIKSLCVFCSSSDQIEKIYFKSAKKIGHLMGKKNLSLVFGAGAIGLMGELAKQVKKYNCPVIGVIPDALNKDHIAFRESDEFIITQTMHQRKEIMFKKADAFLALPGGFGTLEELLEIITLKQLGYHNKPIVILNTNKFFNGLITQFMILYKEKFASKTNSSLYFVTDDEEEAINYIFNY